MKRKVFEKVIEAVAAILIFAGLCGVSAEVHTTSNAVFALQKLASFFIMVCGVMLWVKGTDNKKIL